MFQINKKGELYTPKYKTDLLNLDVLLNGGFPKGRVIGIGAEWGVGKTTLLIQACGNIIEKYDKKVYYIDVEGGATYDLFNSMGYAELLYNPNTNPNGKFIVITTETIENITKIINRVSKEDDTGIIVIDSATQVISEKQTKMDDLGASKKHIGYAARMWSRVAKPIVAVMKKTNACLVLVHQARTDISGFKPRVVASGGNALKHIASAELWGKRKKWIDNVFSTTTYKSKAIGAYVEFTTNKNRLCNPFTKVNIPIFFGRGVSNLWMFKEWLENNSFENEDGKEIPYLKDSNSWFQFNLPFLDKKVHGINKLYDLMHEHFKKIKSFIEEKRN
ncbi:MAG: DNA recombination/repair protein RecA [Candidatus Izimaplasma sp.]|nr:DNA recombination/repair protein RecA [Candidatus Izimaplasma bacterium]